MANRISQFLGDDVVNSTATTKVPETKSKGSKESVSLVKMLKESWKTVAVSLGLGFVLGRISKGK